MSEQMENINVEEIMEEIRAQIKERGYTKKDLRFADIHVDTTEGTECLDEYFELGNFKNTIVKMDGKRNVQCWRLIAGNKFKSFFKKIIRKMTKFYVEPIVEDQNKFNFYTVSAMSQLYAKFEEEQDFKVAQMQQRIEQLEERCKQLEKKIEEQ